MKRYGVILLLLFVIFIPGYAFSHSIGLVHPFSLSGKAWELLRDKTTIGNLITPYNELNAYFYISSAIPSTYNPGEFINNYKTEIKKMGTYGTIDEDNPPISSNVVWHFYNPVTKEGMTGSLFDTAVVRGKPFWDNAINEYVIGNKESAYQNLGHAVHLLQDMSVPAHVQSDLHPGGDDYEETIKAEAGQNVNIGDGTAILQPSTLSYEKFMEEVAQKTYNASCFFGGILIEEEDQPVCDINLEFAKMFPYPKMYYKAFSVTNLAGDYFYIDNVGNWGGVTSNEWWPCVGTNGCYYIENIGGV